MGSVRIAERFTPIRAEGVVVDRDAGVIRNVLVCGFNSANGRRYPADVLRAAVGLYEGRPVNLDHADRPTMGRRIGWLSNVRAGADGRPRADLNILRTHKEADAVFEAAERRPELCGLSHVALCRTRRDRDGVEVIEAIESVESVDLVADPATTPGLKHESKGTAVKVKLTKLVEWLAPKVTFDKLARVKKLSEMDGMDGMEVPEPAAETNPDDAIDGAFKQAMHAVIDGYPDQLDGPGVLAKLKELFKAHGKLGDSGGSDDKPAEDGCRGRRGQEQGVQDRGQARRRRGHPRSHRRVPEGGLQGVRRRRPGPDRVRPGRAAGGGRQAAHGHRPAAGRRREAEGRRPGRGRQTGRVGRRPPGRPADRRQEVRRAPDPLTAPAGRTRRPH